jgi:hypothetical protein
LQENRSTAAEFRQKPLLGKAQSPIPFNALAIFHGRQIKTVNRTARCPVGEARELQPTA